MKFTLISILCLAIGLGLGGCQSLAASDSGPPSSSPMQSLSPDRISTVSGRLASATGCALRYDLYRPAPIPGGTPAPVRNGDARPAPTASRAASPAAPENPAGGATLPPADDREPQAAPADLETLVVLGPGFMRGRTHLSDLAQALAQAGLPAVTLDFCNPTPWNGRHLRNGLDMVLAARALGARRVIHAGFSAGGLAALAAGTLDPRALGVLTLDLVDSQDIGRRVAPRLDRPLIALVGEPSLCNGRGNGLAVLAASPRSQVIRVPGAGHCDFESPSDWRCHLVCGPAPPGRSSPRADIVAAAARLARALADEPL